MSPQTQVLQAEVDKTKILIEFVEKLQKHVDENDTHLIKVDEASDLLKQVLRIEL